VRRGKVVGAVTVQLPQRRCRACPLYWFFWVSERERERGATKEGKKNLLLPAFARPKEEDDVQRCKNNTLLLVFF